VTGVVTGVVTGAVTGAGLVAGLVATEVVLVAADLVLVLRAAAVVRGCLEDGVGFLAGLRACRADFRLAAGVRAGHLPGWVAVLPATAIAAVDLDQ
jgi:hypothetical protein